MRCLAIKHLIEDNSHGPNITLSRVGASVEDLRAHVHRTADQRLVNLIQLCAFLIILGKAKISDLVGLILDQNIRRLEIAMNDRMFMQVLIPSNQLLDDDHSFGFWQFFPLLQHILKRSLVTQLLEEIDVVSGFLDIVQFYNVIILDSLHDLDLILQRFIKLLRILLDVGSRDGLDGYQVAVSNIGPLVDLTIRSPSYLLVDVDNEGLYKLIVGCA